MSITIDNNTIVNVLTSETEITSEDIPGRLVANEGKITVALDINTGDTYCLNSSGIWKKQSSASPLGTPTSMLIMGTSAGAPIVGNLTVQEDE